MVGERLGWVAGTAGIFVTQDGRHWTQQFQTPEPVTGVDFINASSGWVVGLQRLYRTTDGGAHWNALPAASLPIRSIHFAGPLLGWAIAGGDSGTMEAAHGWLVAGVGASLLRSSDGGVTWSRRSSPANPQTVCFTGPSNGWLGAADGVYRSTDGGQSWQASLARPDGPRLASGQKTLVECAGPQAVWVYFQGGGAAMSHSPYLAYASVDARTWRLVFGEWYTESTLMAQTAPYGPDSYPGSFSVIDPYDAAFIGDGPATLKAQMIMATNGGATIARPGQIGDGWWTAGTSFISLSTGWVVVGLNSGDMAIDGTTDGGAHWSRQLVRPNPSLS